MVYSFQKPLFGKRFASGLVTALLLLPLHSSWANGLDRNGTGARSTGKAGAFIADELDAFSSIELNLAALGFLQSADFHASIACAWGDGRFRNSSGGRGSLVDAGVLSPELALRMPITQHASARSITGSEYKDSSVELEAHWLALTVGYQF